jgi:hypothetical protein
MCRGVSRVYGHLERPLLAHGPIPVRGPACIVTVLVTPARAPDELDTYSGLG